MVRGRGERLELFRQRLLAAPPAASALDARALQDRILNEVEDEYTDIPFDPTTGGSDGRFYPAQDDYRFDVPNRPDLLAFRHRKHETYIGPNGAILIVQREDGTVFLTKPGQDGVMVKLDDDDTN